MTQRDRVVMVVVGAGIVLALIAWDVAGPWWSLGLALAAIVVASLVYRVDTSPPAVREVPEGEGAGDARDPVRQ